ncbi:MAG TPA: alpha-galactosidase [Chloroflexia bacterium]|nr:alpha-galactosidase [Chloroflexia bacterium]
MPIQFLEKGQSFLLTTRNTAYAFHLTPDARLVHTYYGAKLKFLEDYPLLPENRSLASFNAETFDMLAEFPATSRVMETESALQVRFSDGTRDLRLVYDSHTLSENEDELNILLRDEHYGLGVNLRYRLYPDCDILTRQVTLTNSGAEAITVEKIMSGSFPLPYERGEFRLTHLAGTWATETQVQRTTVTPGQKVLEGRLNYTGHAHNPFFALDLLSQEGYGATESSGEVWFGALQWSGNWKTVVEQAHTPFRVTRVSAGINDYDFSWQLEPGGTFETPWLTLGYSREGFGTASRNLHRYQLNYVLPRRFAAELRPVLYNSWEAVGFNVREEVQMQLAEKAAKMGAELFVIDDGWFGERHSDKAGLGDWEVNPQKFPNGLNPLIEKVNSLGMQFGIWVEPEMVNPDSDLYRAHPDWAYHFPNRSSTTKRNQLILNLSRQDVQEHLFGWLDRLLSEHNISYVKWDYNRTISEPGWPEAPLEQQREIWVRHVRALYNLVDRLRARHPDVMFEACSGGGGRADMGMLAHFDHTWTSDNTDPLDRLPIQQGYSLAYAPKTMFCWVTDMDLNKGNYSLRYRFHSSFMGSLGVGGNLNHWSEAELAEAAQLVTEYKRIRPIIQQGEQFRLTPLEKGDRELMAVQYLAAGQSEGVVLAFNRRQHFWRNPQRLLLQNLDPEALYTLSGDLLPSEPVRLSGQALMERGILPQLDGLLSSALIYFKKE